MKWTEELQELQDRLIELYTDFKPLGPPLDELQARYEAGDKKALFDALRRVDLPEWLYEALDKSLVSWEVGKARTLDEAFGLERSKGFRQDAYQLDQLSHYIYQFVESYRRENNQNISDSLFDEIGKRFGLSGSKINKLYYNVKTK